jgi:uncharacterized membrane protein YecN with MAPEG domain
LGLAVSLLRGKFDILIGHPDDPKHMMHRIVRAHGNTAEYAPFLAVLFLYLGAHQPAAWVVWVIGLTTLARVLIVIGLLTSGTLARVHPVRFIGAIGTYVGGMVLIAALFTSA